VLMAGISKGNAVASREHVNVAGEQQRLGEITE